MHDETVCSGKKEHAGTICQKYGKFGTGKEDSGVTAMDKIDNLRGTGNQKQYKQTEKHCSGHYEKFINSGFLIPFTIQSCKEKKYDPQESDNQ
jgi:hypothetical protein